jgi:hypothetical protein
MSKMRSLKTFLNIIFVKFIVLKNSFLFVSQLCLKLKTKAALVHPPKGNVPVLAQCSM